jgi:integrase
VFVARNLFPESNPATTVEVSQMASIATSPNGHRRILFYDVMKKRKAIHLGECTKKESETVKLRVESLIIAKTLGLEIKQDDAVWLAGDGKYLREKLAAVGLCESAISKVTPTLKEHLADFLKRHSSKVKPGTVAVWRQVIANLNELMPEGIRLDEITTGHAKAFHDGLKAKGMEQTTIHKRLGFARQFLNDAIDWEIISKNPFAKVKTSTPSTKSNVEVPREWIDQLMPHLDTSWKVIVALSRYGGLRCPSEVLSLRWVDIDWERLRMSVPEPKVEHHSGRGIRSVPIFPELLPILEQAWECAPEGAEFVVDKPGYREAANTGDGWKNANLRTQFLKKLAKAGLPPWDRLFHSMRASRQTELEHQYPTHVVCAWLGNSPRIAQKNYLMVTESDFDKASSFRETNTTRATQESDLRETNTTLSETVTSGSAASNDPANSWVETKKASENTGLQGGGQGIRTLNRFPDA